MKKIPMRRCIATQTSLPKKELLRIVRTPEGEIKVDTTGKLNGKGAYLMKSKEALDILKSKRLLNTTFETEVPDSIYDEILEVING